MGTPERGGSLQVEPGNPWTAEEVELLLELKKSRMSWPEISGSLPGRNPDTCRHRHWLIRNRSRLESEEGKNKVARLYEREKSDMWAQIAAELAAPCSEVEWIHWDLGKTQMEKRGSDDSFSTIRFDLSPPQVDDARLQARRQHQDQQQQQQQQQQRANSEWSGHEETSLFAYRRSGMLWEDISKLLSGRTVTSCQAYFYRQAAIGPGWSQERKNKLCKLYDSLKPSMWAKIGEELKVRWEVAEDMHWRLGAVEMAQRAGVPLSTQATSRLAPLEHDIDNAEVHQHRDQEDDELSRHYHPIHPPLSETEPALMAHEALPGTSVTLPCFADFAAGVELPF